MRFQKDNSYLEGRNSPKFYRDFPCVSVLTRIIPNGTIVDSAQNICFLLYKEQVILHLPAKLDRLHLSAMPTAEGHIFLVDVPVATLYLTQQTALWSFGGAEDGVRSDIVSQH